MPLIFSRFPFVDNIQHTIYPRHFVCVLQKTFPTIPLCLRNAREKIHPKPKCVFRIAGLPDVFLLN